MTKRFFTLFLAISLASVCAIQAQSPTPGESPAKHGGRKKAETAASASETAASPSPAESPAGAPKPKRGRKKAEAGTAASPAASPAVTPKPKGARKKAAAATSPSPSPSRFSLGDLFKPKSSAAASPAAVSAPAKKTSAAAASNPPAPGGGHGLVWVNTDSHVYHKEGSRFYGTTKKGKYMTEAEAQKEGNRAAGKGE